MVTQLKKVINDFNNETKVYSLNNSEEKFIKYSDLKKLLYTLGDNIRQNEFSKIEVVQNYLVITKDFELACENQQTALQLQSIFEQQGLSTIIVKKTNIKGGI